MLRCDRSADETGKTRGGRARVYIINKWCTNVTVREPLCTEHLSTSSTSGHQRQGEGVAVYGASVYINNQWCNNVTEHVELLSVALRPFYLPTEFNHFSITVVYAPLLPLSSRSLMTR